MKITNLKSRLAAAILAACGSWVLPAYSADLKVNLIPNPGFENVNPADPGPFTSVRALDWVDADGDNDDTFAYPYSSLYSGSVAPPGSGLYHFAGGFNTTAGSATIVQTFDVSTGPSGSLISGGNARYDLRGFFSSYFTQGEASLVRASFLNASDAVVGSATIGGTSFLQTVPVQQGRVLWGQDAAVGVLPSSTRRVRVEVIPEGSSTNFDGYVDNLDFRVGGLSDDAALKLEINTTTGAARFRNVTGSPIDFNYYEVVSASGSLNPTGWNSLQDQDFEGSGGVSGTGDGWEEGGRTAFGLSEAFLLGSSVINNSTNVALGNLFNPGGNRDLVFRYGLNSGLLLYGYVDFVGSFGVSGDFDNNGIFNCADVNLLTSQIVAGSNNASFDLTGDGFVNDADLTAWLAEAGAAQLPSGNPYRRGDANLDGVVDGSDFGLWNTSKFTTNSAWCSGNFNADAVIDGSDFGIWNSNKFQSADSTSAIPEPTGWLGAALLFLGRCFRGCGRRARQS